MWIIRLFGKKSEHKQPFTTYATAMAYYEAVELQDGESKELVCCVSGREVLLDIELCIARF